MGLRRQRRKAPRPSGKLATKSLRSQSQRQLHWEFLSKEAWVEAVTATPAGALLVGAAAGAEIFFAALAAGVF